MDNMKEKLKKRLYEILGDRDFVLGVVSPLDGESEMKQVLDYIEANEKVEPSQIILLAMSIDKDRGKDLIIEPNFAKEIIRKE